MLIYSQRLQNTVVYNPWKYPSTLPAKVARDRIQFLLFGILLVSISVHISEHFQKGANWVILLYIWHQTQGIYIGQLDLILVFYYWPNPKEKF